MSDSPQMFFVGQEKRGRGRPRAAEPMSAVCMWVPASKHDQLVRLANQRGISVSRLVKSLVSIGMKRDGAA